MTIEFKSWPKIPRLKSNNITITEKIDGTNACVIIMDGEVVGAQSRNRLINIHDDNMGFANWVFDNAETLAQLGDGYHYGEWAGPGIQGNPHKLQEKQFFLFNTFRPVDTLPEGVSQVPVLYQGVYEDGVVDMAMSDLWDSATSAGYIPEGVIVYYHDTRTYSKDTFLNREGKWAV